MIGGSAGRQEVLTPKTDTRSTYTRRELCRVLANSVGSPPPPTLIFTVLISNSISHRNPLQTHSTQSQLFAVAHSGAVCVCAYAFSHANSLESRIPQDLGFCVDVVAVVVVVVLRFIHSPLLHLLLCS